MSESSTRALLSRLAEEMPPARLTEDPWRTGRRRRRLRVLAAGLAVLALVGASALAAGRLGGDTAVLPAPAAPRDGVPSSVYLPWLWQATVGQSAPGRASLVYYTSETRYLEVTPVIVGRTGAHRLIPTASDADPGLLSPDGRYYVHEGGKVLDLTTGATRNLDQRLAVLAWSPDGRQIVAMRGNDDAVITYYDDGTHSNPNKPDDLVTIDVASDRVAPLITGQVEAYTAAAYSPDGARIAVASQPTIDPAQRLTVIDLATKRPQWSVDLGVRRQLGGRGAWSPDGRRLALLAFDGCPGYPCDQSQAELDARRWRVEFVDAQTGRAVGAPIPVPGTPQEVVGWRSDIGLIMTYTPPAERESRHTVLIAVRPEGQRELLVDTPSEVTGLEVAPDLVAAGQFGGPAWRPSVWAAQWWAYGILAVPLLLLAWVALRRLRLRPGWRTLTFANVVTRMRSPAGG